MALARLGLQFDSWLVFPAPPTRRGGYDSVRQNFCKWRIARRRRLCFNDVVALGVIEALQHAGMRAGQGIWSRRI